MKKILITYLVLLLNYFTFSQVTNFNMSNSTQTVNCGGTFNFYDSGGPGGNYNNNENFTAVFVTNTPGQCLQINFTTFGTESCCDPMTIRDGSTIAAPILGTYQGNVLPPTITCTSGSLCVTFTSDGSVVGIGWSAVISCVACPPPPPYYLQGAGVQTLSCPPTYTLFYDSGGPGSNYSNSENSMRTFSAPAGSCLTFSFTSFQTESCCDFLRIYDGPNGGSPLIGTYSGGTSPGVINSTSNTITFSFTSDGSVNNTGWAAQITCNPPCSGMPGAGTATAIPSQSCVAFNTTLSVTGVAGACGLTYQWQSSPAPGGPFSNIGGATAPTYSLNVATTTYFRRLTTCGAQTATSSVASASVGAVSLPCSLSSYAATNIPYSFDVFVGTVLPTTDDVLFSAVSQFGFPFCFTGQTFNGGYVSSNSSFVFDAVPCFPNIYAMPGAVNATTGIGTGWSITTAAPTPSDNAPRNAILGPWHDINPGVGGVMRMGTLGVAPNRRFVISFENVPMFSCTTMSFTGQIKLFETTGVIQIHIGNKPICTTWNSGQAIMGLHNYDGTIYIPPVNMVAHNAPTQWNMVNTAYSFSSSCPSQSICGVILPVDFKNFYGQQIDGVNKLWWETSDDSKIKEFYIERSTDGENFERIKSVPGGNGPKYTYDDETHKRGFINYYRITAVDQMGLTNTTSIYSVYSTDDPILIKSVYPNPADEVLNLNIQGRGKALSCTFNIYDQFGNKVKTNTQMVNYGMNTNSIDLKDLNNGMYIIEIITGDNNVISKQKFSKL